MSANQANRSKREHGQALIIFVFALTALMGVAALTIDLGMVYHDGSKLQNAADAAALAGAGRLPEGAGIGITEAQLYAQKNGYVNGQNGYTVTVTTPYKGDAFKMEVTISGPTEAMFATAFGIDFFSNSHRAVATYYGEAMVNAALLALNPTACNAYDQGGSSIVVVGGGGIMANSSCNPSLYQNGAGSTTGDVIQYYAPAGYTGNFSPPPRAVPSRMPDPLAGMVPPDLVALGQSPDSGGGPPNPKTKLINGAVTLRPGVYYGGIKITAAAVTLLPGTYVMAGGGFDLGSNAIVSGDGIMIYNTYDPQRPTQAGACASISFSGGASTIFTAQTSGPYKDVVFWQDPSPKCAGVDFKLAGGGTMASGVYYLPGAKFVASGGITLGSAQIIADTFTFSGNAPFSVQTGNYVDLPLQSKPKLIE